MTKHIFCAVDLTDEADARALIAEAKRIAARDAAALSVATVLPDYGMSFVGSFFKDGTLKEASEAARLALHRLAGDDVQCIVEIGTAYEKILSSADAIGADLIVVGAHKPDLADTLMGPNAARVARMAKVSVLVFRPGA